jgi:RpiR family transcriptional regulator, carbohydrate utilization regulator
MTPRSEIEARLMQAQTRLNTHRRQLVQAILDSPSETFFLSSRQLAQRYRVDPATIVRTIQALGYERFADFAADLRQHFVTRLTPYQIMEASARVKGTVTDHVLHTLERDAENLESLRAHLNTTGLLDLAKRIHRARRIVIIGVDLAATLSSFLAYGLLPLGFAAEAPMGSSGNLYHKIRTLTNKDLLIAVSFGRCLKETVDAMLRARERGVLCYGITDTETTPIARYADHFLLASTTSPAFTGSYVGPMALCNAILVACAHIKPKRSLAILRQSETEYRTGPRWFEEVPEPASAGASANAQRARK